MSWFRSNRGAVAWLAFFALTCQLVLSFGHIHLGNFNGGAAARAAAADRGDIPAAVPPSSPQKNPTGPPRDFCAICVNIGLASALVIPDSPVVVTPGSFIQVLPWSSAAGEPAAIDHLLFSARGPPHA